MDPSRVITCEKKIKTAELKIIKIINKINTLKLNDSNISKLDVKRKEVGRQFMEKIFKFKVLVPVAIFVFVCGAWWVYWESSTRNCLLTLPSSSKTVFRPPESCSMCTRVEGVTRVANITSRHFEELYAYDAAPVIVTDATRDWRAIKEFNFDFFKKFYSNGKLGKQTNDCFFFAYKSGLNSLSEVFSMSEKRANLSGDPWYVGWSTCYEEETRGLRRFYKRPYFLPSNAESDMVDWVFMGGPGQGAHMHVDSVKHVSWQAQVRGRKRWELAPPPECLYECRWISFIVEPGEILVVDTNRWYHRTSVLPGDISITIGAEFD